jgi:hypothetical protein
MDTSAKFNHLSPADREEGWPKAGVVLIGKHFV